MSEVIVQRSTSCEVGDDPVCLRHARRQMLVDEGRGVGPKGLTLDGVALEGERGLGALIAT